MVLVQEPVCQCRGPKRHAFDPWVDPLEKEMGTHSSILAWEVTWTEEPGRLYSSWGCKESDTTERLHFLFFFLFHVEDC